MNSDTYQGRLIYDENSMRIIVIVQEALRSLESGAVTAEKREHKHE